MNFKGFRHVEVFFVVIIISIISFVGYMFMNREEVKQIDSFAIVPTVTSLSVIDSTVRLVKTGGFEVDFSYPSLGIPVLRLCFESVADLSEEYCFFRAGGIGSTISPDDVSQVFTTSGNLPVGEYYAYVVVYWDDKPGYIINLNECNYAQSESLRTLVCPDNFEEMSIRDKNIHLGCNYAQSESLRTLVCPDNFEEMSIWDKNIHLGGDRIIFSITEEDILYVGIISLL